MGFFEEKFDDYRHVISLETHERQKELLNEERKFFFLFLFCFVCCFVVN